jgi:C-terminal processing protease CtpA/Prc
VTAIDGVDVTKADIISKLRGPDLPGSPVTISVLKKNMTESVDFKLVRADMRSVMNLKDLYLALGELHTEMDNPRPERLKSKVESLEKRVQV